MFKSTILQYKKKEITSVASGKYFLVSSSGPGICSVSFYEMVTQWQPQEEAEERLKEKKKKGNKFLILRRHDTPQRATEEHCVIRSQGTGARGRPMPRPLLRFGHPWWLTVMHLLTAWETQVPSLGWEDILEK